MIYPHSRDRQTSRQTGRLVFVSGICNRRAVFIVPPVGVGDHNYCRNPDSSELPWCYIAGPDGTVGKQFCAIDKCTGRWTFLTYIIAPPQMNDHKCWNDSYSFRLCSLDAADAAIICFPVNRSLFLFIFKSGLGRKIMRWVVENVPNCSTQRETGERGCSQVFQLWWANKKLLTINEKKVLSGEMY